METVTQAIVKNPFEPFEMEERIEIFSPCKSIVNYIPREFEKMAPEDVIVLLDGELIFPEFRDKIIPRPNARLIFKPSLGSRNVLRFILNVAIIAAAVAVTILMPGIGGALIGAAIAIGGSLLVNTLLPPKTPELTNSQTYTWDGPQLTVGEGAPIPKGYGEFGWGGHVIASYRDVVGDKSWINLLISYGFGVARSIHDIKINGNPAESYKDVIIEKRLGYRVQPVAQHFESIVNDRPQSTHILGGGSAATYTGDRTDTEEIEVEVSFPKGLWAGPNKDNSYDEWTVHYKVEYSLNGSGTWTKALKPRTTVTVGSTPYWIAVDHGQLPGSGEVPVYSTSNNIPDHYEGEPYNNNPSVPTYLNNGTSDGSIAYQQTAYWTKNPLNSTALNDGATPSGASLVTVTDWYSTIGQAAGRKPSPVRHTIRFRVPSKGKWDVRVSKLGSSQHPGGTPTTTHENDTRRGEETWVTGIREYSHTALTYPGMVLLGIRALATDQLSGSALNITSIIDYAEPETIGYKHCVGYDLPYAFYRFNDPNTSSCIDSSGFARHSTYTTTAGITVQQESLIVSSPSKATKFAPGSLITLPGGFGSLGLNWAVDFVCQILTDNGPTSFGLTLVQDSGSTHKISIEGDKKLYYWANGTNYGSSTTLLIGKVYHICFMVRNGIGSFFINGVKDANVTPSMTANTPTLIMDNGPNIVGHTQNTYIVQGFAIYKEDLPEGRINQHYRISSGDNSIEDHVAENPACVDWDITTNYLYGGGVFTWQMNGADYDDWATYNNRLVPDGASGNIYGASFNGVFDQQSTVWDAKIRACLVARSIPIRTGTRYTIATDRPRSAVAVFGMGKMLLDSFKHTWLSMEDRANQVEVWYYDETDDYKRKPLTVTNYQRVELGDNIRPAASIDLIGATNVGQAWREAMYRLLASFALLDAVQFDIDVEALTCQVGDVIKVSHDIPQWGFSGRLAGGISTTSVVLDQQVTIVSGHTYALLIELKSLLRVASTVNAIAGNKITLNGGYDGSRVQRLVIGATDYKVIKYAAGVVWVEDPTGIIVGASFNLYDLDVLETRTVNNAPGTTDTLTLLTAFSTAPEQYDVYAFGEVNTQAYDFRVSSISRASDFKYTIVAGRYDVSVFSDIEPVLPDFTGTDINLLIAVTDVTVNEENHPDAGFVNIGVGWKPGKFTFKASIFVGLDGGPEQLVGTTTSSTYKIENVTRGSVYKIRVVGTGLETQADYVTAPTQTITISALGAYPADITNFRATSWVNPNLGLAWTQATESDFATYEIRFTTATSGAKWEDAVAVLSITNKLTITASLTNGVGTYLIKTLNTSGKYSQNPAGVVIGVNMDILNDGSSFQRPRIGLTLAPDVPYNGDFEQFADGQTVADGWTSEFELGGGTYARSSSAWRGTYAQVINYTGGTTAAVIASRPISVKPGFKYTMSCRAKIDATHAADGFYFRVGWYNTDGDFSRAGFSAFTDLFSGGNNNFTSVGANVYKLFSGEVTAPAGARFARIVVYAYNTPAVATLITVDTVTWNNSTVDLDATVDGTRAAWGSVTQKNNAVDSSGNLILKNKNQAGGSTSSPSYNSASTFSTIPEMTITVTTQGNKVMVNFSGTFYMTYTSAGFIVSGLLALFRDGTQISSAYQIDQEIDAGLNIIQVTISITFVDSPSAGSHTYDIKWHTDGVGTIYSAGTNRYMQLVELG